MNEFSLIKKYIKPLAIKNPGALNLNDDVYYDKKNGTTISVDTYVENVHFLNSRKPEKFLKKILRSSLSDLYCKGVKPKYYFLSFALNKKLSNHKWLSKINKILKKEQKKYNILIAGGDTTYSPNLIITIVALGYAVNKPVFRKNCVINDDVYVTGNIGDAFIGLNVIKKKLNFGKYNSFFCKKFYEPDLQTQFSLKLNKFASASIDVSDGLAQDLNHICVNSNLGAEINLDYLPISSISRLLIKKGKIKLKKIFSNGDDYQILFTSNRKNRSKIINISKKLKTKVTRIGVIKKDKNIVFNYKNKKFKLKNQKMGYKHIF